MLQLVIDLAQPVHKEDEVRAQGAVDEQLTAPVAIGPLLLQEIFLRTTDRIVNLAIRCGIYRTKLRSRARQRNYISRPSHVCGLNDCPIWQWLTFTMLERSAPHGYP